MNANTCIVAAKQNYRASLMNCYNATLVVGWNNDTITKHVTYIAHKQYCNTGGSSVENFRPQPDFSAPLPTHPLRHIAYYKSKFEYSYS